MANWTPYTANTREIAVSVQPTYLEARSSPENSQYFWAYRVVIENHGRETVQLLSRHWMITNARGEYTETWGQTGRSQRISSASEYRASSTSFAVCSIGVPSGKTWGNLGTDGWSEPLK